MKAPTEKWIGEIQAVLSTLDDLDVTERHRKTLRRACEEALVEAEDRIHSEYEHRASGEKWTKDDLALLETTLTEAELCHSWAEEEMILTRLVQQLGRPKKIIKKKAIELGHGKKVDFWINEREQA